MLSNSIHLRYLMTVPTGIRLLPIKDGTEKQQVPVDPNESTENMPVTSAVK